MPLPGEMSTYSKPDGVLVRGLELTSAEQDASQRTGRGSSSMAKEGGGGRRGRVVVVAMRLSRVERRVLLYGCCGVVWLATMTG